MYIIKLLLLLLYLLRSAIRNYGKKSTAVPDTISPRRVNRYNDGVNNDYDDQKQALLYNCTSAGLAHDLPTL